jgi:hypothetical protein
MSARTSGCYISNAVDAMLQLTAAVVKEHNIVPGRGIESNCMLASRRHWLHKAEWSEPDKFVKIPMVMPGFSRLL